jgi:hypothetical protein
LVFFVLVTEVKEMALFAAHDYILVKPGVQKKPLNEVRLLFSSPKPFLPQLMQII